MQRLGATPRVWIDAGPFFRFCEADRLKAMARYLGPRALWVVDVANEIELRANSPRPSLRTHPGLQNLGRLGFPVERPTPLTEAQQLEVNDIRTQLAEPGEHPKKHRGEIATVVVARDHGHELALIDDGDGLRLARQHGVPAISTTNLSVEMVLAEHLSRADGLEIYLSVLRRAPLTEASFERALRRYRDADV